MRQTVTNLYILLDRKPHGVECQSLCGSELTRKTKQLKVRGHVPTAGDANAEFG